MTRKKYVKQLMALGISRNAANAMARVCQVAETPYAADYKRRAPWIRLGYAARRVRAAVLNMTKALNGLAAAAANFRDSLVLHHAQPITPENLEGGKMYIVTAQEHDRLHGYSASVSYVDDLHGQGGGGHE